MEVARYVQSTQNRKLVIFLQSVAAAFVFYCDAKHIDILRGSSKKCYILVSLHSQTRNFLPKHHNTIIKQHSCGEGSSLLFLLQVDVFQQKQGVLQQIILCPSNKSKRACIRPFDTNNFNESLTRKHHHTATDSLYRLCDEKISWTPILAGVSYQFGFVSFPICLQCKISASSVFSIFFHEVSHPKVRKVTDPNF